MLSASSAVTLRGKTVVWCGISEVASRSEFRKCGTKKTSPEPDETGLVLKGEERVWEHFQRGRHSGAAAAITHREQCRQADAAVLPLVLTLHGQGLSLRGIAAALKAAGIPTRQGWPRWHARQVARILERARASEQQQTVGVEPELTEPEVAANVRIY